MIVAIGLFAVGETLWVASRGPAIDEVLPVRGSLWMTAEEWSRSWKPWLRGTAIGFPLGALPAGGAELPTLMSYAIEKRLSKRPEEFGHGAIEAVAGPEAANNASAAGTLVPLLTLGLPTSATAAVLLAAFQQFGLQPGPLLFEHESALVWGVIASLYVGNVMLLVLNLPLVGLWVKLLSIPRPWLYGGILVVASLGAFSVHRSAGDLRPDGRDRHRRIPAARDRCAGRAGDDRPDPRTRPPSSTCGARCRSARATGPSSSRTRCRPRCWPSRQCSRSGESFPVAACCVPADVASRQASFSR